MNIINMKTSLTEQFHCLDNYILSFRIICIISKIFVKVTPSSSLLVDEATEPRRESNLPILLVMGEAGYQTQVYHSIKVKTWSIRSCK